MKDQAVGNWHINTKPELVLVAFPAFGTAHIAHAHAPLVASIYPFHVLVVGN